MRAETLEALERFIEGGGMWDVPAMEHVVEVLEKESGGSRDAGERRVATQGSDGRGGHPGGEGADGSEEERAPAMLAKVFAAILLRMEMAPIDEKLRHDVEAHVYQRLYKVLEAYYDDLPESEVRTRIEVFQRRLSRMIVDENARPVDA